MVRRSLAALALIAVAGHSAPKAALREPTYASGHPRYAVVEFGAKAERRVPIVADGKILFIDRNGNGDLTEPDERVTPNDRGDYVTEVLACDAEGHDGRFTLSMGLEPDADGVPRIRYLSVCPVEDIQKFHTTAALIPLADRPDDAPVIPIDGPLRFVLMDHWTGSTACRVLPRGGGKHEFSILVATPVRGIKGEAYVYPHLYWLQGQELPTVRVEFEQSAGTVEPLPHVWQCECARRYRATVDVPPASETLRARLLVSFPGWKHGELKPATFDLEYATADPERAAPAPPPGPAPR